jgi:preprotein translocase subunit SecG
MKSSMTGQEKDDLLIKVTAWAGTTFKCLSIVYTVSIYYKQPSLIQSSLPSPLLKGQA